MDKKELKAGDEIYKSQYGSISFVCAIERVTTNQAMSSRHKFKKEYTGDGSVTPIPRESYGGYYFIGNEKTKHDYAVQQRRKIVSNFNYSKLSDYDIDKVYDIIKLR